MLRRPLNPDLHSFREGDSLKWFPHSTENKNKNEMALGKPVQSVPVRNACSDDPHSGIQHDARRCALDVGIYWRMVPGHAAVLPGLRMESETLTFMAIRS